MDNTKEQEKLWLPDKSIMTDGMGRQITQSLFLEAGYSEIAIYTLKEADYTFKGRHLYSIKRLYLEMEDTTEYVFATTYFLGWDHWKRIVSNRLFTGHVEGWRKELELKLRARGIQQMIAKAEEGSLQAAKWLADAGWDVRAAGRPSKEEVEGMKKQMASQESAYEKDYTRLMAVR